MLKKANFLLINILKILPLLKMKQILLFIIV